MMSLFIPGVNMLYTAFLTQLEVPFFSLSSPPKYLRSGDNEQRHQWRRKRRRSPFEGQTSRVFTSYTYILGLKLEKSCHLCLSLCKCYQTVAVLLFHPVFSPIPPSPPSNV